MKTTKMITTLALISTLMASSFIKAEEMVLPAIQAPSSLDEGIQRELSQDQIDELLPWATDSKQFLMDLLDNIQVLSNADKIDRLVEGIKQVVGDSSLKSSELLMRYALNRGLVIKGILDKEMASSMVGSTDAKLRVLTLSVKTAIEYYDADMDVLKKKSKAPFLAFGLKYYSFLTDVNKSIFDASAQYNVQRTSLEWLQWDVYRDLNNAAYATQIIKINNGLKVFPTTKLSDAQSINYLRQMKNLAQQLVFGKIKLGAERDSNEGDYNGNSIFQNKNLTADKKKNRDGSFTFTGLKYFRGDSVYLLHRENNFITVCNALGYRNSIAGDGLNYYDTIGGYDTMLVLNAKGDFEKTYTRVDAYVAKVTCANSLSYVIDSNQKKNLDGSTTVSDIRYVRGDLKFMLHRETSFQSLCKAMGFSTSVAGDGLNYYDTIGGYESMLVLNTKGDFEKTYSRVDAYVAKVTCQ